MSESQPVLSYFTPPQFDDPAREGEVVIQRAAPSASTAVGWLMAGLVVVVLATIVLVAVGIGAVGESGFGFGGLSFLLLVLAGGGLATAWLVRLIRRHRQYGELPVTFRVDRTGRVTIYSPRNWGLEGRSWAAGEVERITAGPVRRALSGERWFELRLWLVTLNQVGVAVRAEDGERPGELAEALWRAVKGKPAEPGEPLTHSGGL